MITYENFMLLLPLVWVALAMWAAVKTRYRLAFGLVAVGQLVQFLYIVMWKVVVATPSLSSDLIGFLHWPGSQILMLLSHLLVTAGFALLVWSLIQKNALPCREDTLN